MADNLTMQDILDEQIDQEAFTGETPGKRYFRQKRGTYAANVMDMWIREKADGRRYVSLLLKLHDPATGGFRGTTFCEASWRMSRNAKGDLDKMSQLFKQIIVAIKAPSTAGLDEVLPAIKGEWFDVWGTEFFTVAVDDAPEDKVREGNTYKKIRVFINDDEDDLAMKFLRMGYESKLFIHSISPMTKQAEQEIDDDIPF